MTNQMTMFHSLKRYSIILIGIFAFFLGSCKTAYPQNETGDVVTQAQEDILGTWVSAEGGNTKWVVTDSQIKTYKEDRLDKTYNYSILRTANHCGYDVSDRLEKYPWQSILTLNDTQSDKKKCYYIYGINNSHLTLSPFGYASFLSFEKQQ